MPNRLIKDTIFSSRKVNNLSDFDFRIWIHLIVYVDDYGCGSADPELLKGMVFPRRKGLTEQQISCALDNLANAGMIDLYEVDGEPYLYFPNWAKHQQIRACKSKFPGPDGKTIHKKPTEGKSRNLKSVDINGNRQKTDVPVIQSTPIQSTTTRACEEAEPFLSDEEAMIIQAEQNEVLDSAKQAGFPTTTKAMNTLIRLYTEHGKETLMFAIDECVRYNKLNFAYMEKVCKNHGSEGSQPSQDDRGLEEWD